MEQLLQKPGGKRGKTWQRTAAGGSIIMRVTSLSLSHKCSLCRSLQSTTSKTKLPLSKTGGCQRAPHSTPSEGRWIASHREARTWWTAEVVPTIPDPLPTAPEKPWAAVETASMTDTPPVTAALTNPTTIGLTEVPVFLAYLQAMPETAWHQLQQGTSNTRGISVSDEDTSNTSGRDGGRQKVSILKYTQWQHRLKKQTHNVYSVPYWKKTSPLNTNLLNC